MDVNMPYLASDFTGFPIFIYDTKNNLITRTTVTGSNRDEMYIEVSEGLKDVKPRTRLQLLIIHSSGASELNGFLKIVRQGIYEISIYGERQREVRASKRRTINASAVISDMISEPQTETLKNPVAVTIENMSTTGILLRSKSKRFVIGALLQVEMNINGKILILYGEVIREQILSDNTYKYGCKLNFLD